MLSRGIGHAPAQKPVVDENTFSDMGLWLVGLGYADTIAPHQSNPNGTRIMAITEQDVQSALKQLVDPNTKTDYITGKSAKNIKVDGNNVSVDVLLGYPAKSQVEPIRKEIAAKLKSLPGVGSVTVNVASVPAGVRYSSSCRRGVS